jgi:hypothetical protein
MCLPLVDAQLGSDFVAGCLLQGIHCTADQSQDKL